MANKKLIAFEQLQKLTKGLYDKLHGEVGVVAAAAQKNLSDISAVSTRMTDAEGKLNTIEGEGAGSIKKALKDAKAYADKQDGTLHTTITEEVNGVKSALQADIDKKADATVMNNALALKAAQADLEAEVQAREAADTAIKGRLDVIEGEENVDGSIKKALKDAKADAAANYATKGTVGALDGRVGTAESDIDKIEVALGKDAQGNIKPISDRIAEVNSAASALEGRVTQAEKDIDAIEKDYLKKADKDELKGLITTAQTQADKGVADAATAKGVADAAKDKIDAFMLAADTSEKAIDTLKEIQDYITTDGTAAKKMTADIAARVKQTDYDKKVGELEAADTALQGRATALETLVGKKAQGDQEATGLVKEIADNKAGIATNKTEIANLKAAVGNVEKVAAQSALEAVERRVGTVESDVDDLQAAVGAPAAEGKVATGLYKAVADEAARAQGAEDALDGRVDTLEATVGNASSGLVKDVDDLQAAVSTLNGSSHTHDNKTTLNAITATVKEGYDNAVAKVTGDAATEGTIANAKKAGTDAKAAVDGLKLGVDLTDDTKAVVQLKTSANAVQSSVEIVYPYEFVTDAEIQAIIDGLGTQGK